RNNLADLKTLRRHVSSDMFRQIISSIMYRVFFVNEDEIFKVVGNEYDISLEKNEGRMLFNLIYSI
ncbi:hypothetical protein P9502_23540, partial [Enterobacter pseudoroggenkampii]